MFFSFNSNKMFFFFILIFSTMISISSNSWFGCWIGLEINLLSFIPLISNSNNLLSSETSLKYFLTQSIASVNLLFMIFFNLLMMKNFYLIFNNSNIILMMTNLPLLMKMGSVPFHFWFVNIIEGLSWLNCFILMTWQKIAPIILLSYYYNYNFLLLILLMNTIVGAVGGINQTSIRKLMTFSSINNLGWMIFSIMISENLWMFYYFIYSFIISVLCFLFYMFNLFFLNQMFIFNMNYLVKIYFFFNLMSLGGLPPFTGFFPKWIIINFLMINNLFFIVFIFVMSSLIMLYFYIRILYSSFLFNYLKIKWLMTYLKYNFTFYFISLMSLISTMGMIFSTFFFI